MEYILCYLLAVNVAAWIFYGVDKWKARHKAWRIPEWVLLLLAFAGGSAGALIGMRTFHHKTRKPKFAIGVPALLAVQCAAFVWFLY